MTLLIVALAIVFIVLTIAVISKTQTLLKGVKGSSEQNDEVVDSANNLNAIGLLVFWILSVIGVFWSFFYAKKDFLIAFGDIPSAASVHGKETDYWFWVSMVVVTAAFILVNSVLFYFPVKYRYDKNRKAHYYPHNNTLEIVWTLIPAVVMAALVFTGLRVWNKVMADAPKDAEIIEIMGKQFGWQVRYGGVENGKLGNYNYKLIDDAAGNEFGLDFSDENSFDDFTSSTEMHIPKGKPVLLKIRARDVLHSVFIPHMRVKMDAVPGMPTKFWFIADKSTADMRAELGNPDFKYEIACTEVCGRSHFGMKLILVVDEPADYEKWKKEQKSLLASKPEFLEKVPAGLKAKALKYFPTEAPADSTTASAGTSLPTVSALR
ncbi:cytochrome c oxidase subunit II [Emticicia oligotrophica DSM 17448]|uniref:Cytochrome c oxidase subunit 2 n=1 Tax=Emticicia oligotrophica (strain DSM 17448 / CIP 109782 / MTCC 6937 / GPTSA100-15) TaxID=929562 RepID=A0ABN4AKQ2_EMTOG|nr:MULTISPECIES: cytochrome c oxidase subunit II [Emticicia]AFK02877.1 cytochrome c oxidase subunit II [Emticicia oligotrophica DSM 17448]